MQLRAPRLLQTKVVFPSAREVPRQTFDVLDPASGRCVAEVQRASPEDAAIAVSEAHAAFQDWKRTPHTTRAAVLRQASALLKQHAADLAQIVVAEQGKPLREALGEILYGASYFDWFANEILRPQQPRIPWESKRDTAHVGQEPVGVCVGITPWNFPMAMVARKVSAALAAGCSMVLKPAEATPLSALALSEVLSEAGLPDGLFCVLPCPREDAALIGKVLCANPLVRKLSFTGSTAIGKQLAVQSADTVKRLSLELGGNAPFIVFDDAPLKTAVRAAVSAKFLNAGQTCISPNRFIVQQGCLDAFTSEITKATQVLKQGSGLEGGVQLGPLISDAAVSKVKSHVADAIQNGATLLSGGCASPLGGRFVSPTVLTNVTPAMRVFREETFGPVVAICSFSTDSEALTLANATESGLASYLYSSDTARCQQIAGELEFGMIGVNTTLISGAAAPFGGIKQSGYGREGSRFGLDDYLQHKFQCVGGL